MFTPDIDTDGPAVTAPMAPSFWRRGEVGAIRSADLTTTISDGVARAIAASWQSPNPLDAQTTALAAGLPYHTADLIEEIDRHRALAREAFLGASFIEAVGELDLLVTWALSRGGR